MFCGSVRIVYAIIYTLFLVRDASTLFFEANVIQGFGLTIGSDLYLVVDRRARRIYYQGNIQDYVYIHGTFSSTNGSTPLTNIKGVIGWEGNATGLQHVYKGENYRLSIFS